MFVYSEICRRQTPHCTHASVHCQCTRSEHHLAFWHFWKLTNSWTLTCSRNATFYMSYCISITNICNIVVIHEANTCYKRYNTVQRRRPLNGDDETWTLCVKNTASKRLNYLELNQSSGSSGGRPLLVGFSDFFPTEVFTFDETFLRTSVSEAVSIEAATFIDSSNCSDKQTFFSGFPIEMS